MKHRPEIDGLRTVAVIPVILFHAGFSVFSGGFVGVDIFLVISGFLITAILIDELQTTGRVSILGFYERRARRILPALLFVMGCCLPVAWFVLLPAQMEELGRNIVAVALFASNISLWLTTDYFAPDAELNPLLHTWSLAVEEQFYIFFPLLLWSVWKAGRKWAFLTVIVVSIISLAASEWAWRNAPAANFYLLPTRAWELGAGSICAFLLHGRERRGNWLLSLAGLALIVYAIFWFDAETPFPSLWTLVPVVGTGLIILYAASTNIVGKALSHPAMVGIGLVSYSAYLWHQPLFAFARLTSLATPSIELMSLLAIASIALGYLTWRFIENPFRHLSARRALVLPKRSALFAASAIALVAFVGVGAASTVSDGLPGRLTLSGKSYTELDLANRLTQNNGLDLMCRTDFQNLPECRTGDNPRVLLWGDSYAMHLGQALKSSPTAAPFAQLTKSSCGPLVGISIYGAAYPGTFGDACIAFNDQVIDYIKTAGIELVIASSAMNTLTRDIYTREGEVADRGAFDRVEQSMRETTDLVHAAGARLIWISPAPRTGEDLSKCAVRALILGDTEEAVCDFSFGDEGDEYHRINAFLEEAEAFVPVIFLNDLMCQDGRCPTLIDETIMYIDNGHLTIEGAHLVGERFDLMGLAIKNAR